MTADLAINRKIFEINREMKLLGLWKADAPCWVTDYDKRDFWSEEDFIQWLQFVFLPNCLVRTHRYAGQGRKYIVLQVKKYFVKDIQKGKLLQLLIELDALI